MARRSSPFLCIGVHYLFMVHAYGMQSAEQDNDAEDNRRIGSHAFGFRLVQMHYKSSYCSAREEFRLDSAGHGKGRNAMDWLTT
jgi:hypothetical protein